MSVRVTTLAAAALSAGLAHLALAVPAFAQPVEAVAIPYQDLNLGHEAGREVLDRRIALAARRACGEAGIAELRWSQVIRTCREEFTASARSQRDALLAGGD